MRHVVNPKHVFKKLETSAWHELSSNETSIYVWYHWGDKKIILNKRPTLQYLLHDSETDCHIKNYSDMMYLIMEKLLEPIAKQWKVKYQAITVKDI